MFYITNKKLCYAITPCMYVFELQGNAHKSAHDSLTTTFKLDPFADWNRRNTLGIKGPNLTVEQSKTLLLPRGIIIS